MADVYGNGEIRLTTGQNVVIPNVPAERVPKLFQEALLKQFSPQPSPFVRGLVACIGTDYCNLALIETKSRASRSPQALHEKMGAVGNPLTIHWSGCPAGCGNHEAADIGLRGFKTKIDGKIVDAVAVYVGGRTGPYAVAGKEILATVPCDEAFPEVMARGDRIVPAENEYEQRAECRADPFFTSRCNAGTRLVAIFCVERGGCRELKNACVRSIRGIVSGADYSEMAVHKFSRIDCSDAGEPARAGNEPSD